MEAQFEAILNALARSPGLVYLFLFAASVIENVFPPIPGDVIMIFGAYLAGQGLIEVGWVSAVTVVGSLGGIFLAYLVGRRYGRRLILSGKIPWVNPEQVRKAEAWFDRWGWRVVLANRFLSVIRAVISLTAGISGMRFAKFALFALLSVLLWNGCLITAGYVIGQNFRFLMDLVVTYNWIVAGLIVLAIILFFLRGNRIRRGRTDSRNRQKG